MKITKEQIEKVNERLSTDGHSWDQGIYKEPYGIPTRIKEPVVYIRWVARGAEGGSCWGDEAEYYESREGEADALDNWFALDYLLEDVCPGLTFLQYKQVLKLIDKNVYEENEYYGNYSEHEVRFIKVSELEKFLDKI